MVEEVDIPYRAPRVLEHLPETHARFEIEPSDDPTLAFDLILPRDWAHSAQLGPVAQGLLQERGLCLFAPSLEMRAPSVAVTVTPTPFELPVDAYLRAAFEREGFRVVAGKWFPGPCGLFYELTGTRTHDGLELIRRTSGRVDGARLICVNTACVRELWDAIKEDFWTAHVTFSMLKSSGSAQMEPWLRAQSRGLRFEIVYPQSWTSEPAEESSEDNSGIHVRLADVEQDKLYAYILVRAQRRPQLANERPAVWINAALKLLENSGLEQVGEPVPLSEDEDPRSIAIEGWQGAFCGNGRVRDAELFWRVGFIKRGGVLVTLALYCSKKHDDLFVWLRSQRAFEIVRGGLELPA